MPKEIWDMRDGEKFTLEGCHEAKQKLKASPFNLVDITNVSLEDLTLMAEAVHWYTSLGNKIDEIRRGIMDLKRANQPEVPNSESEVVEDV